MNPNSPFFSRSSPSRPRTVDKTYGVLPFTWHRLLEVLATFRQIEKAVLFGSRALGRARRGSDIDLVLMGPEVTSRIALEVAGQLNEREPLPYQFDVLSWNQVDSPELREHVERAGKVIFQRG